MFERYSISASLQKISESLKVDVPDSYTPFYNAGPGQVLPVITHQNPEGISFFYWGLSPHWSKEKAISEKLINIRLEVLNDKPSLRNRLLSRRCIVPADGFYIWKKVGGQTEIPYRFFSKNTEIMSFAGIWEEYEEESGECVHTFKIFTQSLHEASHPIKQRMPLILDDEGKQNWLSTNFNESNWSTALSSPPYLTMESHPVSPRINSLKINEKSLIIPSTASDRFGNYTLFD